MFKIRKSEEIVQSMIDYTRGQNAEITDYRVGGRIRTIYEAVGNMFEELYYRLWQGAKALIEEQIYKAFDFGTLPANRATGVATFSRTTPAPSDIPIAAGSNLTTETQETLIPVVYETIGNAVLKAGQTFVDIPIRAMQPGSFANVTSDKLTVLKTSVPGVTAVTNAEAIVNGTDGETKEARKLRFRKYMISRSQGTTPALKYASEQVTGVTVATIRENPELTMFAFDTSANLYVDNSASCNNPYGTAFSALPSPASTGDILYIGALQKFDFVYLRLPATYTVGTGVWEYWNGSAWAAIPSITDGTTGLNKSGLVHFPIPAAWRDVKVNNAYRFWIRYRLTSNWSSDPLMTYAFASPPPGYVDVYIQDANAEASDTLVSSVSTVLASYRGSGVTVNVRKPTKTLLPVDCAVKINPAYDSATVLDKVEQKIIEHLNAFTLGQNFMVAKLENAILNLDEGSGSMVESVNITTPVDDMLANPGEIFRPDTSNINVSAVN